VKQTSDIEIYLLIKYIKKRSLGSSEKPVLNRGHMVPKCWPSDDAVCFITIPVARNKFRNTFPSL